MLLALTFAFSILLIVGCSKDAVQQKQKFELICPKDVTEQSCQSQQTIDSKFADWLSSATFTGGCNASIIHSNKVAPKACGSTSVVTFTVTSSCDSMISCTAYFYVDAAPVQVMLCPTSQIEATGQTQAEIDQKFASWLASVVSPGGCNSIVINDSKGAPSASGGTVTVKFEVKSDCEPTKICSASFAVF